MKKLLILLLLSLTFANSSVVKLSDKNFESIIKESNKSIVMFSAPWCGACKKMKPNYFETSKSFEGNVKFFSIDTDAEEEISTKYGIESIPTIIVFENGKELSRNVGSLDESEIKLFIDPSKMIKKEHQKCMDGNSSSCLQLAEFYEGRKDYNKTIFYDKKACEENELSACTDLANLYYYGEEITLDYDKAQQYYEKACRLGYEDGCEAIEDLKNEGKDTNVTVAIAIILILLFYIIPIVLHYKQTRVILKNKESRVIKKVPFSFSWTMFIFGFWVPLFRAHFTWFALSLILSFVTAGLGSIVLALFYNTLYIENLLSKGYEPANDEAKALLDSKGIKYGLSKSLEKSEQ